MPRCPPSVPGEVALASEAQRGRASLPECRAPFADVAPSRCPRVPPISGRLTALDSGTAIATDRQSFGVRQDPADERGREWQPSDHRVLHVVGEQLRLLASFVDQELSTNDALVFASEAEKPAFTTSKSSANGDTWAKPKFTDSCETSGAAHLAREETETFDTCKLAGPFNAADDETGEQKNSVSKSSSPERGLSAEEKPCLVGVDEFASPASPRPVDLGEAWQMRDEVVEPALAGEAGETCDEVELALAVAAKGSAPNKSSSRLLRSALSNREREESLCKVRSESQKTDGDVIRRQRLLSQFDRLDARGQGYLTAEDCWNILQTNGKEKSTYEAVIEMLEALQRELFTNTDCRKASSFQSGGYEVATLDKDAFVYLMDNGGCFSNDSTQADLQLLFDAFLAEDARAFEFPTPRGSRGRKATTNRSEKTRAASIALDTVPAFMIMVNAVCIGVEADYATGTLVWQYIECFFLLFFSGEFILKSYLEGCEHIWLGSDKWWNYFDFFCICTASVDVFIAYLNRYYLDGDGLDMQGFMLVKILRLARLARLVRLLRFKVFHELKMMVQGVISGVRVLLWAVVLLFLVIFILGIIMRNLVGNDHEEFGELTAAMFTLFRCFTDGCSAYNGTPLQERLRAQYGIAWMVAYMMVFLFVFVGIFNLIMAIFIDNVVTAHVQRKQQQLGESAEYMEERIYDVIAMLFADQEGVLPKKAKRWGRNANSTLSGLFMKSKESSVPPCDELRVVRKDVFNQWLLEDDVMALLEEVDVETSTKYELFDALDVDSGGELTVEELVSGLMKLRGPISKNDIVATRLKVTYITELIEDICRKLGIGLACDMTHKAVRSDTGNMRLGSYDSSPSLPEQQ